METTCSILIVDDDPGICSSLRDILEVHPSYRIDVASSGREALGACASTSYDVVVLDMKLPDMSGLDLVPRLETRLPGAEILVITGYASPEGAAEAVRPSTAAYLTKPIDLERLLTIVDGISRRKALERENHRLLESLRRAEAQWARTFDAISDPLIVCDTRGITERVNRAFCRRFGTPVEEAIGRPGHELLLGTQAGSHPTPALPKASGPRQERGDLAVPGVFEVSCDRVELAEGTGVLYALRDLTERRSAEEALRRRETELFRAQKMEMVGRLASGIAHDFNNLLTIILSETDLALLDIHEEDPLCARLDRISSAAQRSTELSKRLLGLGRLRPVESQPCDLNRLLDDSDSMLRRLLGDGIELHRSLAPDLGPVQADPVQLEQVLVNLVSNARDAMPEGGTVWLETCARPLSVVGSSARTQGGTQGRPGVMLSVGDSGSGIDPEIRGKIFEPFFTTKARGAGLGLAMVHGIVERAGGTLEFDSDPDRGTTFRVVLPRAEVGDGSEATPAAVLRRRPATVLFVDDDSMIRQLAVEILTRDGYRVLSAEDGEEALGVVGKHDGPIDLLITDVLMPRLDGQELAERFSERFPEVPILFISGFPDQRLPAGSRYLQKPFSLQTLVVRVQEILARNAWRPVR